MSSKTEKVYFGGGCFWCTEAVFQSIRGVLTVKPGYSGGTEDNPLYEDVAHGKTGHAETVEIVYDPSKVEFKDLLTVFFATHDPTSINQQGADIGTQYRSAIFYTTEEQKRRSEKFIEHINNSDSMGKRVVTQVEPLKTFYEADARHKDYYKRNSENRYCQIVINPKLEKVQRDFAELLNNND